METNEELINEARALNEARLRDFNYIAHTPGALRAITSTGSLAWSAYSTGLPTRSKRQPPNPNGSSAGTAARTG